MDTPTIDPMTQDRYKKQFFKTSLCKYHLEGACRKGDLCTHAHDKRELHEKPVLSKTRMCKSVLRNGQCGDPSCAFSHDIPELISSNAFFRTKMCEFYKSGGCKLGDKCRYAHSKEELNDNLITDARTRASTDDTVCMTKPVTLRPPMVDFNDSPDTGYAMKKKSSMGSAATMASTSYASFGTFETFQQQAPIVYVYPAGVPAFAAYHPMYHSGQQYYHD